MIYYLATKSFSNTMRSFLATWGKDLKSRVRVINYPEAFKQKRFLPGTYIFSDLERLPACETEQAAAIYNALAAKWGDSVTVLNHPTRSMKRYELLRMLYNARINPHNVYRVTEQRLPEKYPVFIRAADDHGGALSPLIHSESELLRTLEKMNRQGISRENKIIVEFCDTADPDGIYRKYSAFNVNGMIMPRHVCFGKDWQIKNPDLSGHPLVEEELAFVSENRHEAELKRVFALAGIDYGRIDYGVQNGRIRVWEINTNPRLASFVSAEDPARRKVHDLFVSRFSRALADLDKNVSPAIGPAENPIRKQLIRARALEQAKYLGESLLFLLPLSPRRTGRIRDKLVAVKNRIQNNGPRSFNVNNRRGGTDE